MFYCTTNISDDWMFKKNERMIRYDSKTDTNSIMLCLLNIKTTHYREISVCIWFDMPDEIISKRHFWVHILTHFQMSWDPRISIHRPHILLLVFMFVETPAGRPIFGYTIYWNLDLGSPLWTILMEIPHFSIFKEILQ